MPTNIKMKTRNDEECRKYPPQKGKFLQAFENFLDNKTQSPSIDDLIMAVDADMPRLYELLASSDTKTARETARKNVNKWLRGKHKPSKASQNKFKRLFLITPDKDMKISVSGCYVISDRYQKTKKPASVTLNRNEVNAFLKEALRDDYTAITLFNQRYFYSRSAMWLNNVIITVTWE